MKREAFVADLTSKGRSQNEVQTILLDVEEMETFIQKQGSTLDTMDVTLLRKYLDTLMDTNRNELPRFRNMARYFHFTRRHDLYIYFTTLFGSLEVMDQIKQHIHPNVQTQVFANLQEPSFGSDIQRNPPYTREVMEKLLDLMDRTQVRKSLAHNNHQIPKEAFQTEKEIFDETDSLDDYLIGLNQRGIDTLQKHADTNVIWFEQEINQDVVDYVKRNPEIMSATRVGNKLYTAKIPYDTINFLKTYDPILKRYYACHCPFVRAELKHGPTQVDKDWCYCSAGFTKVLYEVLFEEEVEIEVLESVLSGSTLCRFAITIPDKILKTKTPEVHYENDRY